MKRVCVCLLLLSACATIPTAGERRARADELAAQQDWRAAILPTGAFDLHAYLPPRQVAAELLTVYIEGDGFSWINGSQPSADPTPRVPLALRLALAHPEGNAAYLARPCQYVNAEATACPSRFWTESRFAPEVVAATDRAIDTLMQQFQARQLILVGYSGGGAVAMLVAARRKDIARVLTVAGNLDTLAWTNHHRLRPLDGSLNPADQIDALQSIPQWHLVGGKDEVVPPALVENFAGRFPAGSRPVVEVELAFDHLCCWADEWPALWRRLRASK